MALNGLLKSDLWLLAITQALKTEHHARGLDSACRTKLMSSTLHLTLAEYDTMVQVGAFDHVHRKVELIHGELIELNPAGPIHDDLVTYLTDWSVRRSDEKQTIVTSQTGLDLPEQESRPEPDLMWLRRGRYSRSHPTAQDVQLAIEVSHNSLVYDFEQKRKLYAAASIVEYWIVDAIAHCIHVFTDPDGGDYAVRHVFKKGENLAPQIASFAILDLSDLFNGL
jgi:Uma2 family endonuclease